MSNRDSCDSSCRTSTGSWFQPKGKKDRRSAMAHKQTHIIHSVNEFEEFHLLTTSTAEVKGFDRMFWGRTYPERKLLRFASPRSQYGLGFPASTSRHVLQIILVTFSCYKYFDHPSIVEPAWMREIFWNINVHEVPHSTPTEWFFFVHERILQRGTQGRIFNFSWLTVTVLLQSSMCQHLFVTNNPDLIFDLSVNFRGDKRASITCPFCFIGVATATVYDIYTSCTHHL